MEVPTVEDPAPPAEALEPDLPLASDDKYLATASKEYREGQIDRALWARALGQSNDESQAIAAYLRARATALRLQKRERRLERRVKRAVAGEEATKRKTGPQAQPTLSASRASGMRRMLHSRIGAVAAAVLVAAFAGVVAARWWIGPPGEAEPANAVTVRPSTERAAPIALEQPVAPSGGVVKESESLEELKASVQRLKDAGNWNVLVLHASKWTREEPANAAAWNELSTGYVRLNQLDDALSAATRAAELSPEDVATWRNVGHLNLALERLPEAGAAFDRVLAANAEDTDALCGSALVAQGMGRPKDALAIAGRAKAAGASCQGSSDGESVAVVVKAAGNSKSPSSVAHRR